MSPSNQYTYKHDETYNLVVGKNGCGKSTFLRWLNDQGSDQSIAYISPERSGHLMSNAGMENRYTSNPKITWNERKVNQFSQFKEGSFARIRSLESKESRQAESENRTPRFETHYLSTINTLLDNVSFSIKGGNLVFQNKTGTEVEAKNLSSGESELVALAIEVLVFKFDNPKGGILLLDEPDVHLHPDLQVRFCEFLINQLNGTNLKVFIATHSTVFLAALAGQDSARFALMNNDDKEIVFRKIGTITRDLLPVFGAHPLSKIFNDDPLLLVEGEDDFRVWQQVIRSSGFKVRLFPVVCGDKQSMSRYEKEANSILSCVYDDAIAHSLRDRDDGDQEISDEGCVKRYKTNCYEIENLLLADEVLAKVGLGHGQLKDRIAEWLDVNKQHQSYESVKALNDDYENRQNIKIKDIRNIIVCDLFGINKSWEVLLGQAIAESLDQVGFNSQSIKGYLGGQFYKDVLKKTA